MLVLFFDAQGVIHREFVCNQMITAAVYLQILQNLAVSIQTKRPALWHSGLFVLHHDNAPAHKANIVQQWLGQRHWRILRHPAYSPDLAPADFWMFPRLKKVLQGICFPDLNTLEFETDRLLGLIPHFEYQKAVTDTWKHRMQRCIGREGNYFEGMPH